MRRFWLLRLRDFYLWLERALVRAQARAEERRRATLSRLVMLDAPKPARPMRYRRLSRLFWGGL